MIKLNYTPMFCYTSNLKGLICLIVFTFSHRMQDMQTAFNTQKTNTKYNIVLYPVQHVISPALVAR